MVTPVRITDSLHTRDNAAGDGRMVDSITVEYPTCSPFNLDGSLLLLVHKSYFALYDGSGKYLRDLPFEVNASAQPRWSRRDENTIYFLSGNSVKRCNAATGEIALVHQFREYFGINGFGEADISDDGNYLVLCGDGQYVFTWQIGTPPIGTRAEISGGIESLMLTPRNNVLVSYHTNGSARLCGVELFDRNMQFIRQVLPYNCHKDVMRDRDGEEVLIHSNGNDQDPTIPAPSLVATRLSNGIQKQICRTVWQLAEHISCPIGQDFFFVDRYDPTNEAEGDILKVRLDGRVEVLCLHGSKAFPPENKYTWQPKVSCSRDGSKVVYASNSGIGTPANYSDVYMVQIGS